MQNPLDQMMDSQKQFFDFWAKSAQNAAGTLKAKATATPELLFTEFFEKQKQLFQEMMKMGDPQEAMGKAPEQFNKWMQSQKEFSDRWMDYYKTQMAQNPAQIPGFAEFGKMFGESGHNMNWWSGDVFKGMQDKLNDFMPFNMQPHFGNFGDLYKNMFGNWTGIQKMIQHGISNMDTVNTYFSPDSYKELLNKMMGFQQIGDVTKVADQINVFFQKWIDSIQAPNPKMEDVLKVWQNGFQQLSGRDLNGSSTMMLDMGNFIQKQLDSFNQISGQGKESKMAKMLKDMQHAYVQHFIKKSELQSMVYQSGQFAMPDTIRHFYQNWNKDASLPEFEQFLNQYIDVLEGYLLDVLKSDNYSALQADVAKSTAGLQAKLEEFSAVAMENTPFLLKTHGKDIALESSALRQKIRKLEARQSELESKLTEAIEQLNKATASTKSTVKEAAVKAPAAVKPVAKAPVAVKPVVRAVAKAPVALKPVVKAVAKAPVALKPVAKAIVKAVAPAAKAQGKPAIVANPSSAKAKPAVAKGKGNKA